MARCGNDTPCFCFFTCHSCIQVSLHRKVSFYMTYMFHICSYQITETFLPGTLLISTFLSFSFKCFINYILCALTDFSSNRLQTFFSSIFTHTDFFTSQGLFPYNTFLHTVCTVLMMDFHLTNVLNVCPNSSLASLNILLDFTHIYSKV